MKSLERKNEDLRDKIAIRDETIEQLQSNIKQMEVEHQKRIQEVKQSYEVEHRKQSEYIDKILRYFPYVEKLMPMIKYLSEKMGFNDNLIKALCTFKEIPVKGKLYSTMFNQSFSADSAVCSLKEDKEGRFDLKNRWRFASLLVQTQERWVYGSIRIADKQTTKSRVETLKCITSRNNLPIQGLLFRLFCKFAVG